MKTNTNPYRQQLLEKGYSLRETYAPSRQKRQFPLTIGLRTFQTEEEYQDALYDFLNGN